MPGTVLNPGRGSLYVTLSVGCDIIPQADEETEAQRGKGPRKGPAAGQ